MLRAGGSPVKLVFLGTRGEIESRTERHEHHSALLFLHAGRRVMVDCGLDWLGKVAELAPDAVAVTHAHPDHAGGLRSGAPCPVYATDVALRAMRRYPIDAVAIRSRVPVELAGLRFEAFAVEHSLRAPAVGYRVSDGMTTVFYVPDVVMIREQSEALYGLQLYVGDGASLRRSIIRRRDGVLIGHASIRAQLGWCATEGVPRAIFTHCGSQLVRGDAEALVAEVAAMGVERGLRADIAYDGLRLDLD